MESRLVFLNLFNDAAVNFDLLRCYVQCSRMIAAMSFEHLGLCLSYCGIIAAMSFCAHLGWCLSYCGMIELHELHTQEHFEWFRCTAQSRSVDQTIKADSISLCLRL